MKKTKQIILVKRCSRCNSTLLIDAKTGLCWLCRTREQLSFEIEYIKVAQEDK